MRHLILASFLVCSLVTGPLASRASAVTVEELFNLKINGLSDEILVALLQSDGSVFQLLPEDVLMLYRRGLSEKVILAMIATSRRAPQVPTETVVAPVPMQQTVIHPVQLINSSPVEVNVPVAVPVSVFVPVNPRRIDRFDQPAHRPYWGFGGELRPDAWGQRDHRDGRVDSDRKPDYREPSPPAQRR